MRFVQAYNINMKMDKKRELLEFQPYKVFYVDNQTYLFDGSSASIYKIDNTVMELLKYEGKGLEEVFEKLCGKIDGKVLRDTLDKMKSCGFVSDNSITLNCEEIPCIKGVTLMLIQACNLACKYCFGSEGEYADKGVMSKQVAFDSIDYIIEHSGNIQELHITFFGGEPLLCFELIKQIVEYCKNKELVSGKKFKYSMTTNGTLLNDEINQFIIKNRIGTMISIDGDCEQQNAKRYYKNGNGCYDEVIEKTAYLREIGHLTARATITESNLELKKVFEHLNSLGFESIPMAPAYNLLTDEEHGVYIKELNILCDYFGKLLRTDVNKAKKIKILWKAIKRIHSGAKQYTACGAGVHGVAVDIHGNLFPCHRFVSNKEFILGNIHSKEDARKDFANDINIESIDACKNCYLRLLCGGGCSYENYVEAGSVHSVYKRQCEETQVIYNNVIAIYLTLSEDEKKEIFK